MPNRSKQPHAFRLVSDQRGAAAIIVTIIMLAIAVLVVSTTALMGLDSLDIGMATQTGNDAILSGQSCVEEAMIRLSRNHSYTGGTLDVGDASCTIVVTGTPCGDCTIDVTSSEQGYTRSVQAGVSVAGSLVDLTSWQEIE